MEWDRGVKMRITNKQDQPQIVNDLKGRSIIVQTIKGNNILKKQLFEISPFESNQLAHLKREYDNVIFIGKPNPVYNCNGLTFASKRTGVYDTDEIVKILKEDNYIQISIRCLIPGDIILYFSDE